MLKGCTHHDHLILIVLAYKTDTEHPFPNYPLLEKVPPL